MGSAKIPLVFYKYGLGFVTYGVKNDSFGFCLIWVGFVTYGVSKDTFGFCQIWVGFFSLFGLEKIHQGFVKYGLGFVTYKVQTDSVQFCHIWVGFVMGFVIYGQYSAATTFYEQWEVRLGQARDLSALSPFFWSLSGFVVYGRGMPISDKILSPYMTNLLPIYDKPHNITI